MARLASTFNEFILRPNLSIVLNTEGLYFITHDKKFRDIVKNADLIYVDGIGLKIALQLSGYKKVQRLHGPDLFHNTLHKNHGKKQLIIGGSEKSHEMLCDKYENLSNNPLVEFYSEFVNEKDLTHMFEKIDSFKPDIIYVCLGIRKQEYIGHKIRERFNSCSIVGLGASIDFESGNVVRSSRVFQKLGLEWLPRLIREPRMIPRIFRSLLGLLKYSLLGCFRFIFKTSTLLKTIEKNN